MQTPQPTDNGVAHTPSGSASRMELRSSFHTPLPPRARQAKIGAPTKASNQIKLKIQLKSELEKLVHEDDLYQDIKVTHGTDTLTDEVIFNAFKAKGWFPKVTDGWEPYVGLMKIVLNSWQPVYPLNHGDVVILSPTLTAEPEGMESRTPLWLTEASDISYKQSLGNLGVVEVHRNGEGEATDIISSAADGGPGGGEGGGGEGGFPLRNPSPVQ